MRKMSAADYDAACELVLEAYETAGLTGARATAELLCGLDVLGHDIAFMIKNGRQNRRAAA